ncbi:zinc ribbon domain-containing protein [Saccharothrix hoggarensis]
MADVRQCPQCGAPVPDGDDFCGNCGTYLGWADQLPTEPDLPQLTLDSVLPDPAPPTAAALLPDQPGPVPPARPVPRRPLRTAAAADTVTGPPCPSCGTPNPPGRRFCRRCAAPLRGDVRRHSGRSGRRWRWHGDRSRWLRRLVALLAVAVLALAVVLFQPTALRLLEDLRDRLATPAPVAPSVATATAEVAGHPASAAVDGLSNRYWGAPAVGDAVEFTFTTPFRLLSVVVHTGAGVEPAVFAGQARATALDVVVTASDGTHRTIPVVLGDRSGPQRTDTGVSDVVRVRLVVRGAAGLEPGRHVALGEVEFFRRP